MNVGVLLNCRWVIERFCAFYTLIGVFLTRGYISVKVMMMGSTSVAKVLLKHGADPNVADSSTGATPLHDAARTGFVETVRLLVEYQADPQATDNTGCRPIDLAQANDHKEVVTFLESL